MSSANYLHTIHNSRRQSAYDRFHKQGLLIIQNAAHIYQQFPLAYCQPALLQSTRIQNEHTATCAHPCIDWIFQFQYPNIVADGMETCIELKSTVSNYIIVPLIKGCDQYPAALI